MDFFKNTLSAEFDNGFRCYFLYRPGPAVEMQVHVATGSMHEGKHLGCGLSHFLEHMLFQGCKNFPGHAVADTVTALGGDLNAYTGCDRTCYRMTLPATAWRQGIDMLSSMVRFPELPAERFIREKEVILRECERSMDNVGNRMLEKFLRTMFLTHPLRHPVIGYKELIATVDRDMAMEYHQLRYTPDRSFAVITGNADAADLFAYAGEKFGDWKRRELEEIILPQENIPIGGRKGEFVFNDPLSRAMWGVQAPEFGSRELPATDVLFGILGTGDGSLLNTEMVIKQRSVLNIRSFCFPLGNQTMAGVSMECEPGKLNRAEKELEKLLDLCADGKISAARMEREKSQQYADRLRSLRNMISAAGEIAEGVLRAGDPGAGDRYIEQLQKISIDDLRQCAGALLGSKAWIKLRQLNKAPQMKMQKSALKQEISVSALKRGVSMLWTPDKSLPLCCFSLILPGGTIYEAPGKAGISQLCSSMMCAEMIGMGEEAVLKKLDELCVDIDVSSGANSLMLEFSVPKKKFAAAVDFMGRLLGNAEFTPEVFERERHYLLERLKVRREQPVKAAFDKVQQTLYAEHPYASGTSGKVEDLQALTLAEVQEFYRTLWNKSRVTLGFAGDCTAEDAEMLAEKFLSHIVFADEERKLPEEPAFPEEIKRIEFALPREQTVVLRSIPGVSLQDIDTVNALEILSMMENGLGSQLFKSVREDNALSYSVGMTFSSGFHTGLVSFYAMTAAGAGEQVLNLFEAEISRLATADFTDDEFESAKKSAAFECETSFTKPESLLRTALLENYYGFNAADILNKSEMLRNFPREKFTAALKKLFTSPGGAAVLVTSEITD